VVVHSDFGAAQSRKERLGLIGAGIAIRIGQHVIDPFCQITRVQNLPTGCFVGIDHATGGEALTG